MTPEELAEAIAAARLEALEEAAKIVESAPIGAVLSNHHVLAELCILALEIRALKDGK